MISKMKIVNFQSEWFVLCVAFVLVIFFIFLQRKKSLIYVTAIRVDILIKCIESIAHSAKRFLFYHRQRYLFCFQLNFPFTKNQILKHVKMSKWNRAQYILFYFVVARSISNFQNKITVSIPFITKSKGFFFVAWFALLSHTLNLCVCVLGNHFRFAFVVGLTIVWFNGKQGIVHTQSTKASSFFEMKIHDFI